MIVRVPIKACYRPSRKRGPTGLFFAVGTSEAEVGEETDASESPFGLLPEGCATVGGVAEPVLDAAEEEGYAPEDYADRLDTDDDSYEQEIVLYAVVEDYPEDSDGTEWVRFEAVEDSGAE